MTEVVPDSDLLERVRSSLAAEAGPPTPARLAAALRSEGAVLGDAAVLEVSKQLRSEISGAGPLEALLREPGVTDVLVNCPDEVWVDRGAGLERSPVRLRDEAAVRGLAQRLAAAAGRRLDAAAPFVDVRLPGGYPVARGAAAGLSRRHGDLVSGTGGYQLRLGRAHECRHRAR